MPILDQYLEKQRKRRQRLLTLAKFAAAEVGKNSSGDALQLAWRCERESRLMEPVLVTRPDHWPEVQMYGRFELGENPATHLTRILQREVMAVPDHILEGVLNFQDGVLEVVTVMWHDDPYPGMENPQYVRRGRART